MTSKYSILLLIFLVAGLWHPINAQEVQSTDEIQKIKQDIEQVKKETNGLKPGKSRFLLRGYAHAGLEVTEDEFSFVGGAFNPLFIYKQSDRLLFESELEFELINGETELGLEYVNISYLLTKNITFRAGKILLPFGIFVPNLHPAWINKFPSGPLGAGHGGILPRADIGFEFRGGVYVGDTKINYSAYVVNGPRLNNGEDEPEEAGMLHYGFVPDNNKGKSVGGRLGVFPFHDSSLELGASGMYGKVGDKDSEYKDVSALNYAFDLSYVKSLPFMSSVLDVKAQYSGVNVDDANYPDHENPGDRVTFDNTSTTWFAQVSLRPALVENKIFRNLELVGRYSELKTPVGSEWETNRTAFDIGINYWLDWRSLFKVSYRILDSGGEAPGGGDPGHTENLGNTFFVHWAIGF
jgi:hypothetical protein